MPNPMVQYRPCLVPGNNVTNTANIVAQSLAAVPILPNLSRALVPKKVGGLVIALVIAQAGTLLPGTKRAASTLHPSPSETKNHRQPQTSKPSASPGYLLTIA